MTATTERIRLTATVVRARLEDIIAGHEADIRLGQNSPAHWDGDRIARWHRVNDREEARRRSMIRAVRGVLDDASLLTLFTDYLRVGWIDRPWIDHNQLQWALRSFLGGEHADSSRRAWDAIQNDEDGPHRCDDDAD